MIAFGRITSGGDMTLAGMSVSGGDLTSAGGRIIVTAPVGITLGKLSSASTAVLTAANGGINVSDVGAGSIGASGRELAIVATGNLVATDLTATTGAINLRGGSIAVGNANASGFIDARTGSGALSFGTLASGGDTTILGATTVTGTTLTTGGAARITSPGGIDIANLRAVGAATLNASNGPVRISNDLSAATLTASGQSLYLRSRGGLTATTLSATDGAIDIGTAGAFGFSTITASGATMISAGTTVSGTTLTSGGATTVTAPAGITIDTLRSTGPATLTATNGQVRVNTEVSGSNNVIADGQSIFIRNAGALSLNEVRSSTGDVDIVTGGNLSINAATAAGSLSLGSSGGNLSVGSIGGGQLSPTSVSLAALGSVTLGDATTRGALNLTAGTVANLNGAIVAPTIALRSADVAIGGNARVGAVGTTTQLTLTSTAGTSTVGGSTTGSGYRLTEAEAQRLSANNILFATQPVTQGQTAIDPNATPSLVLDTLSLGTTQGQAGFANLASTGTLRFQTQGTMRVVGPVRMTGAGTGNRLELAAGPAIQVRPGGSASLVNGSDLAGTLVLSATDIIASDANTLSGLATASGAAAQSDLLGANIGAVDDSGYFAANAINVTVGNGFFVQNTGTSQAAGARTYGQRRGLTVGTGGLSIAAASQQTGSITVAINGRQVSSATTGGFVTGIDFPPLVSLGDPTRLAAGSTINGCVIGATCRVDFGTVDPGIVARDTIDELVESALDAATNAINVPDVLVDLPGFSALVGQPLIEDPVTGSGNDDLLADKDGKQCDPSTETCTKD